MKKKMTLTGKILLGLFLGFIFGLVLKQLPEGNIKDTIILGGILKILGSGFTSAIKMMVVPLVFVSLICGTASMGDVKKLGRIGGKTMLFYLGTTAIAIITALFLGSVLKPGVGLDMSNMISGDKKLGRIGGKTMLFYLGTTAIAIITALFLGSVLKPGVGLDMSNMISGEVAIGESKSLVDIILNIIPTNPIQSLANGEMLQVIFFALLTGLALNMVGENAAPIKTIFESANEVCMKMVNIIMLFAPYGVFALVANTFATVGSDAIIVLLKYILIVLLGMIIHVTIVYGGLFKLFTKQSIKPFLKKFTRVAAVTFSTASSNASVPVSLEVMEELGVGKTTRSFTIPMGATINMDGTAIMQGVAALFIIMLFAPYGVFALVANTFATVGSDAIIVLLKYILIVLLGMIIHVTIVYGGLFKLFTKQSIKPFLKKFTRVAAVTFSTASSNASVPVSLEVMEELGVGKTTRSFTIPMGATINMDGTAIMQGVAALFIAQIYGVDLGINAMITIILTATLASIGTAGVPGVGMIMLSMVLTSVGLPLEGIGLIMGVERIIDMFRTTVNVMGDNIATLIIANSEKDLNVDDYNSKVINEIA